MATAACPALNHMPTNSHIPLAHDGRFSGYASLFDIPDQGGDIVARGAFAGTLARLGPSGVRMLFQHDPKEPVGIWTSIVEDSRGLHVEGRLTLGNARSRDIDALIAVGAIDGLSIGFKTVASQKLARSGHRRLTRIELWEISIVTFPMLPGARITKISPQTYPRPPNPGDTASRSRALAATSDPLKELAASIRAAATPR